ncbi:MAG: M23 family metallopeptidase [Desulfobacteraceae bacterium]|nr:M23 family metallopeptidase [Desulfobacteraceae bacterium]
MAFKKITIFMVPDGTNRVKQFRIPRFLSAFLVLILCLLGVFLSWIIRDYRAVRAQMPQLAELEEENQQYKKQLVHLASRVDLATKEMGELRVFDSKLRGMLNLDTEGERGNVGGIGGTSPILSDPKKAADGEQALVLSMHKSLDHLDEEVGLGERDRTEVYKFLENQKIVLSSTPSILPTKGWLSSRFGYRISPFTDKKEFHRGIDISTRMGAPIIAPADGIVSYTGRQRGHGNVLVLKHGYGLESKYAHLKKALSKKGQYVKRGETIALVGKSGRTTGAHLHYEIHLNKVPVNPLGYVLD